MKHARKNGFELNRKVFNPHFVWDYNHFYLKWLIFKDESPESIEIIKYEDIISDVSQFLSDFGKSIGEIPDSDSIRNPTSVFMSKRFTGKKRKFYSEQKFLDLLKNEEKMAICEILDEQIIEFYNLGV